MLHISQNFVEFHPNLPSLFRHWKTAFAWKSNRVTLQNFALHPAWLNTSEFSKTTTWNGITLIVNPIGARYPLMQIRGSREPRNSNNGSRFGVPQRIKQSWRLILRRDFAKDNKTTISPHLARSVASRAGLYLSHSEIIWGAWIGPIWLRRIQECPLNWT